MAILVTGGAGYIGSHTCVKLLEAGKEVIVLDNLSNSKKESLERVKEITGKEVIFYEVDMLNNNEMEEVFKKHKIDSVIHFAGLKAVGESVAIPLKYYKNNIIGTLNLLELMQKYEVRNLVFSSSATVYGDPETVPITENFPTGGVTNPYGKTKLMIEEILKDFQEADKSFNIAILRYFNPIGANKSGKIGENPNGIPNNLLPYVSQVAVGKLKVLQIFGGDYETKDGTGVRDYIHVVDLAIGHLKALDKLESNPGVVIYNLGTGIGYSVLDIVKAFENATGQKIPYKVVSRRAGDIAKCYADPQKAKEELDWESKKGIAEMCEDIWRWQSQNPNGYED